MSLQTFFDSFALITDASNGVQKLRDLVLQLAVEGKLDTHNRSDESASKLLERIQIKRNQLLGENRMSQTRALSLNDKANYALPFNWKLVPLGEVQLFTNGYAFKSGDYQPEGIGIVRIGDISNGEISKLHMRYVSPEFLKSLDPKYQVRKGDLLIAMSGATTGKLGFNKTDDIFLLNQRVGKIQFIELSSAYGFFFLTTKISENLNSSSGSAIPNLSTEQINKIPFPLPPLEEQIRIVARVDELMRLCDELEARQLARRESRVRLNNATLAPLNKAASLVAEEFEEACQCLDDNFASLYESAETVGKLRATILQLAVQGKLVSQDPNDEPAAALLKKVEADKENLIKEKRISEDEPPTSIESNDEPFTVSLGWEWVRLSQITNAIHYGYTASADHNLKAVRLLRITDIQNNKVNWETVPGCEIDGKKLRGVRLENNDILIARTGGTIGKSYIVENLSLTAVFASYLIRAIPNKDLCANYLKLFLESELYWTQLYAKSMGTGQPNVNATSLKSLVVPLPPLEEQKRIVAKVNQLMALCDELETKLRQAEADSEKLVNAAMQGVLSSTEKPIPIEQSTLRPRSRQG